jgi:predicted metalloendopeptidase
MDELDKQKARIALVNCIVSESIGLAKVLKALPLKHKLDVDANLKNIEIYLKEYLQLERKK